jgi:redox-sensitive bicupin YhaK (pirin superfamily)
MVEPHFTMLWDHDIPRHTVTDRDGRTADVTVIAGELEGHRPPAPPPHSWASRDDSDVALWHVVLDPGASWTMPAARHEDTHRVVYLFDGSGQTLADTNGESERIDGSTGAVVEASGPTTLTADGHVELLVMQARPIGEPVAMQGPFVMNTRDEIVEAFSDYRRTQFGGWPWDRPDPTHGHSPTRFARHADGRVEEAVPAAETFTTT